MRDCKSCPHYPIDCSPVEWCKLEVEQLEKENAELKEKIKHRNCIDCSNHGNQIEVLKLKAQIEKMKCCENSTTTLNGDFISCCLQEEVIAKNEAIAELENKLNESNELCNKQAMRIADLEERIEKMKCCGNCGFAIHNRLDGTFCEREAEYRQANEKCNKWRQQNE